MPMSSIEKILIYVECVWEVVREKTWLGAYFSKENVFGCYEDRKLQILMFVGGILSLLMCVFIMLSLIMMGSNYQQNTGINLLETYPVGIFIANLGYRCAIILGGTLTILSWYGIIYGYVQKKRGKKCQ